MKELYQIKDLKQAKALLNPLRVAILALLREPKTCLEISEELEFSQQRVNNNIQELTKAGLVKRVESRQKRNMVEGVYQAIGRTYWFSPELAKEKKSRKLREQESLHNLLKMSERLQEDTSILFDKTTSENIPSIGVTAEIVLRTEQEREAFTKDFLKAMHAVLEKYQGGGKKSERYTSMIVCYPSVQSSEE